MCSCSRRAAGGFVKINLDEELAPDMGRFARRAHARRLLRQHDRHRVVPDFVIQGGDPTGEGSGGPGYKTVDVPPSGAAYTKGMVAMAKTPTEAPGTSGSQFFVVTAEDAGLTAEYAIVGEVTQGYDTVERIEALGDVNTEQPLHWPRSSA